MKVAITTSTPQFNTQLEPRFGRCAYFVIIDTETHDWESMKNPAADAMGGAGTRAAQFLSDQEVQAVISGDFGPNAYATLEAAGIEMFKSQIDQVDVLFEKYLSGQLEQISGPTGPQRHRGGYQQSGRNR